MISTQQHLKPSATLRIAVIGAGGIGSAFAFQLASAGHHDVTAIARRGSNRLEQMRRDGGIVSVKGEHAKVHVSDTLDEQIPYDGVVVTLQAHRIDSLIPALQRSAAKSILFLSNNFEPEKLIAAVGAQRCCFGLPLIQAMVETDGKLKSTIGAGGQKTKVGQQDWVDVLNAAGLPAVFEPEMPLWLRCHVPLCIAFESVSVAGVRRGGGASWREAMVTARGVQESFSLITGLGYKLYPAGKVRLHASPTSVVAAMLWGMSRIRSFRELLATGIDECRALVDALVAAAPRARPGVVVAKIEMMKPTAK